MKRPFLALLVFCATVSYSQKLTNFESIKIEKASDCKAAEPFALEAANYIFSSPFNPNDPDRLKSAQFIIKWMSATPDYKFSLDETATRLMKGSDFIIAMYMGAMTRYVLSNKDAAKDEKSIKINAVIMLLDYCGNPANNLKMTKNLKKMAEARANGKLEDELL